MLLALAASCIVPGPGDEGAGIETTLEGSVPATVAATRGAFSRLGITEIDANTTATYGMAVGVAAGGSRVVVAVNGAGPGRVSLRVDTDGPADPALERRLVERVAKSLAAHYR